MLTLLDNLLLLSLHEEKCTVLPGLAKRLEIGLSGAMLAELILQGKVQIGSSHKFKPVNAEPTGNDLLDSALNLFQSSEHAHKASFWVKHLHEEAGGYRKKVFSGLISAGVINQGEDGLSWNIPYTDSPNQQASAKYLAKARLRELALTNGEAELRDVGLLSLAKASRLLNIIFTKDERKAVQNWIYAAMMNKVMNDPAAQALQEVELAVEALAARS